MAGMRVHVFGPLSVWRDGELLRLPGGRARIVLAVLALHLGEPVSRDRLVDAAWGGRAPVTSATQLQGLVSALRRALPPGLIETHGRAYLLRVEPDALDLAVVQTGVEAARAAARAGRASDAAASYRTALDRWQGVAFDGLDSAYLAAHVQRLHQLRVLVVEEWAGVELELGRPAAVVDALARQLVDDPLRESLSALLMTALYRAGRQADALTIFRSARVALRDALGIEPGPDLQQLHQRILAADPTLNLPASDRGSRRPATVPLAQLPPDVADFTGRGDEVKHLVDVLATGSTEAHGAAPIALVTGTGGVGKTTLAVHVAHQLRPRYPDGQLYVNLRGGGAQPVTPCQVAGRVLRDLGVEDRAIPTDEDARNALYRSALADRRLLIVLDDARDAAHVRPLLPASATSAVLVTSRHRMPGLPATTRLQLDGLDPAEAGTLFTRIIGPERAAAEPDAVAHIVAACGHHPLAVRVAASRLATRPNWGVATLADRLERSGRRLDELATEDQQVRATFEFSYRGLSTEQARAFRLLAIADLDEVSAAAAAALLDLDQRAAETLAETLVDVNLLNPTAPGRYRYHDLLRLFGGEKADQADTPAAHAEALGRLLAWYHDTTAAATRSARPGYLPDTWDRNPFPEPDHARAWLDREHRNITLILVQCAGLPNPDTDLLAGTLHRTQWYLRARGHWHTWEQAARAILGAAIRTQAPAAELTARGNLGQLAVLRGDTDRACEELTRTLNLARVTRDRCAEAYTLNRLGLLAHYRGHQLEAIDRHERALIIFTELDELRGRWTALTNLGKVYRVIHQPQRALRMLDTAARLAADLADPESETVVLHHIACCHSDLGNHDEAIAAHQACLALIRHLGQREGEAYTLAELGRTHLAAHRPAAAITHLRQALDLFRELGDANATADFLTELGHAYQQAGDRVAATAAWTEALRYYESHDSTLVDAVRQNLAAV